MIENEIIEDLEKLNADRKEITEGLEFLDADRLETVKDLEAMIEMKNQSEGVEEIREES